MGNNTRNPRLQKAVIGAGDILKVVVYTPITRKCENCMGNSAIAGNLPCLVCLSNGFVEVRTKGRMSRIARRLEDKRRKKAGVTIVVVEE